MATKLPPKLEDAVSTLESWLPNYDHGKGSYPEFLMRLLASMPGGDEAEDVGYEPLTSMGWQEVQMLGDLLSAIESHRDVEEVVARLVGGEEEADGEEQDGEDD